MAFSGLTLLCPGTSERPLSCLKKAGRDGVLDVSKLTQLNVRTGAGRSYGRLLQLPANAGEQSAWCAGPCHPNAQGFQNAWSVASCKRCFPLIQRGCKRLQLDPAARVTTTWIMAVQRVSFTAAAAFSERYGASVRIGAPVGSPQPRCDEPRQRSADEEAAKRRPE